MKVIFKEDVPGTADAGEVKVVKNGFARNYLIPQGLALAATPDNLQRARSIEQAAQEKRIKFSQEWGDVAKALEGTEVVVEVRVGPSGRLFGAVTSRNIAEQLTEKTGREIDHRMVLIGAAIHEPGDYDVQVRLYRDVIAGIKVSVIPEDYVTPDMEELVNAPVDEAVSIEPDAGDGSSVDVEENPATEDADSQAVEEEPLEEKES